MDISEKRLEELKTAERKLNALERGGVDNWEWYDESLREFFKEQERQENIETFVDYLLVTICEDIEEPAGRGAGYGIRNETQIEVEKLLKEFIENELKK